MTQPRTEHTVVPDTAPLGHQPMPESIVFRIAPDVWRYRRAWAPVCLLLFIALTGPLWTIDPLHTDIGRAMAPPSLHHWFGTDNVGRDVFARVIAATRLDLLIAAAAVVSSAAVGTAVGVASAYESGWIDRLIQRGVDILMAFPLFVVALALAAVFGNSVGSMILATAIINLPFYIRLSRAEIASRREAGFVDAALMNSAGRLRILFIELLPTVFAPVLAQMTTNAGWAMINSAGLSFLGLGIRPPTAEWGVLVSEGAPYMITGQWWLATFPSLALAVSAWAFSQSGEYLRRAFDPTRS